MRTWIGVARALAAIGVLFVPVAARAMQCQVTGMKVVIVSMPGLEGTLDVPGLVFPVTIGPGGTFALDVSGFPKTAFTIVGVDSDLAFPPTVVTGTIDAGGNVQVPPVQMDFVVHLGSDIPLGASVALTTGITSVTIGKDYVTEGSPLDFGTGALSLRGQVVIPNPPVLGSAVSTGLEIDCTLSPIPDRSTLASAPKLAGAKGSGKIVQDAGDKLKLSARFTQGAQAIDPANTDVFIRVRNAMNEDALLVHVPAGSLAAKGKRLSLADPDGKKLSVIAGRKTVNGTKVPVSGSVVLRRTKKGFNVALEQEGIDLTALGTPTGTVSVMLGDVTASDGVKLARRSAKVSLR